MTYHQRKMLEAWGVLALLLAVVWAFQEEPQIARWAFAPAAVYALLNWQLVQFLQRASLSPKQVIEESRLLKLWVIGAYVLQIAVAFSVLLAGHSLLEYLPGFGSLFLAAIFPLIPPLFGSQVELYRRLGKGLDG